MELIELHILQSFPVTCLNRDDVGAPKSAVFGGCQRARVSSQCWKRAIRTLARGYEPASFAGERTRFVIKALQERFEDRGQPAGSARVLAMGAADALGKLDDPEKGNVKTLLYFSPMELDAVVDALLAQDFSDLLEVLTRPDAEDKKAQKEKETAQKSLDKLAEKAAKELGGAVKDAADIAIFGRMVADDHSLMKEGAGLFSHALTTHAAANEIDFFSAVDDLNVTDRGSGHMGTLEFSSGCYYRYVGLNLDLLKEEGHLAHFSDDEREKVVRAFLKAAILAVPEARKNSMFGHNPPHYVLGLRRKGQPISLINAFEAPVRSSNGFLEESRTRLKGHWDHLKDAYCLGGKDLSVETELPQKNLDAFIKDLA